MKRMHKECFTAVQCTDGRCPNAEIDMCDERYGFGIAEDIGLHETYCSRCMYNTGQCKDCLFIDNEICEEGVTFASLGLPDHGIIEL